MLSRCLSVVALVLVLALVLPLVTGACGDSAKEKAPVQGAALTGLPSVAEATPAAPLGPLPLGLATVEAYGYGGGKGRRDFERAQAARKAKDWGAAEAALVAALAADPGHLEAHRLLAGALAMQNKDDQVAEHLRIALAADWRRWGHGVEGDPELARWLGTPRGARLKELNAAYGDEYLRRIREGVLLVGRRSPRRNPRVGEALALLRSEVYAWDRETRRWLRVTRTIGTLAGWLPLGEGQIAYVTFTKVRARAGAATLIVDARVGTLDLTKPPTAGLRDARLPEAVPALRLQQDGGKLVVTAGDLLGDGAPLLRSWVVDAAGARLKDAKAAPEQGVQLVVGADVAYLVDRDAAGVEADWDDGARPEAAAGSFRLTATRKTVTLPSGQYALRASFVWSPSRSRLAFATRGDPCAADPAARLASLYVVDAATGNLRFLKKAEGRVAARFVDDDTLVHEDDGATVRIVNAADGAEIERLSAEGGLGLHGVAAPLVCRVMPATTDETGQAPPPEPPVDDATPPEE